MGGWGWDAQFEELAASPESRSAFVQNLKAFVDEYRLDGVDMDWEYPDQGQSSQNFLALIKELRVAMPDKLLTTAVVSYGDEHGLGVPNKSFALFDFVNIMTYDGPDHGTMEQFERGLSYWSERGLPNEKIVMGAPFYGDPNMPYLQNCAGGPECRANRQLRLLRHHLSLQWHSDHSDQNTDRHGESRRHDVLGAGPRRTGRVVTCECHLSSCKFQSLIIHLRPFAIFVSARQNSFNWRFQ